MSEIRILTEYIIKTKKLGYKDEKINFVLFRVGWPIKKIKHAFLIAKIKLFFFGFNKLIFKKIITSIKTGLYAAFIYIPIQIADILIKIIVFLLSPIFYTLFFIFYIYPNTIFKRISKITHADILFISKIISTISRRFYETEEKTAAFVKTEKRIFIRLLVKSILYIYQIIKIILISAPSKSIKQTRQILKSIFMKLNSRILRIILTMENGIKYLGSQLAAPFNIIFNKLKPFGKKIKIISYSASQEKIPADGPAFTGITKSEKKEGDKIAIKQKNIKIKPIPQGFAPSSVLLSKNIILEIYQFFPFLISNTILALKELTIMMFQTFLINPASFIYSKTRNIFSPSPFIGEELEIEQKQFASLPGRIKISDILSLSIRMFKTRRMRTFLTVLGMSIGIGTILFLVSLGYGLQNIIFQRIASAEALLTLDVIASEKGLITLNIESLQKIKNLPRVISASPMSMINGQIILDELHANTAIYAIDPMYLALGGIKPVIGDNIPEGDGNKIMVSTALISLFNIENPEDILNKEVKFNLLMQKNIDEDTEIIERNDAYKIIGIIDDAETSLVYLPLKSLNDLNIQNFSQIKVKVNSESDLEQIRQEIVNMGFLVSAVSDLLEQATKIFRTIQVILGVFGFVALIVSAIGMFNTMTIALLERTQEIGIMKALGATPRDIWLLFLFESIIMGAAGGLGGIFIGVASSQIFNLGLNILAHAVNAQSINIFQRPIWFIATIAIFSILVGFFTGLWPANRASKLNTLAALRYK